MTDENESENASVYSSVVQYRNGRQTANISSMRVCACTPPKRLHSRAEASSPTVNSRLQTSAA